MSKITATIQAQAGDAVKRLNPHIFGLSALQPKLVPSTVKQPQAKEAKKPSAGSQLEERFLKFWESQGGPPLAREHKFHPTRKWRLDFAHLPTKTSFEINGGTWIKSGHSSGRGIDRDYEKLNNLTLLGWRPFMLSAALLTAPNVRELIEFVKADQV